MERSRRRDILLRACFVALLIGVTAAAVLRSGSVESQVAEDTGATPPPLGPVVTAQETTAGGFQWAFWAWRTASLPQGICFELMLRYDRLARFANLGWRGIGDNCTETLPTYDNPLYARAQMVDVATGLRLKNIDDPSLRPLSMMYGLAHQRLSRVRVTYCDGKMLEAPAVPAPSIAADTSSFIVMRERMLEAKKAEGLDAAGAVVAMAPGFQGSTCKLESDPTRARIFTRFYGSQYWES